MSEITLFFGKTNPEFSSFYIAPFEIDGITYNSVEHYFMFKKAREFDPDGDVIKQMGNDKTPSQMKKLGRKVQNFDGKRWNGYMDGMPYLTSNADRAMFGGNYAKFTQNPELADKLLKTGTSILAEASPFDKLWGIGKGISNATVYDMSSWKGLNKLGVILMLIRGILRYDDFLSKQPVPEFKNELYIPMWSHDWEFETFSEFWEQVRDPESTEVDTIVKGWSSEHGTDYEDMVITLNLGFMIIYNMHFWDGGVIDYVYGLYKENCWSSGF